MALYISYVNSRLCVKLNQTKFLNILLSIKTVSAAFKWTLKVLFTQVVILYFTNKWSKQAVPSVDI